MNDRPDAPSTLRLFLLVGGLAAALFATRLLAPSDLVDYGQELPIAYTLDALQNGHWLVQWDTFGSIISKPPLFNWLAIVSAKICGGVNRFSMTLPAGLATLGAAWLVLGAGKKYFGWRAGLTGAVAYLVSAMVLKQIALVRVDGLFAFTVAATALLAFRAWNSGGGWTWFWFAAALSTLTKGPLGLLLAGFGLFAAVWERRTKHPAAVRGSHWIGLAVFLLPAGGWFFLAYREAGQPLIDKMLGKELLGHAVEGGRKGISSAHFYLPPLYFLSRFAPWSLLAGVALWRAVRRPAVEPVERRLERFLACWFGLGLLVFSLAAHQRADLLLPLLPAAALLAGREIARWMESWNSRRVLAACAIAALLGWAGTAFEFFRHRPRMAEVIQTKAMLTLAENIRRQTGDGFPLTHLDSSPVLQMHLGVIQPQVAPERVAKLLRGDAPAFVVVNKLDRLQELLGTNGPPLQILDDGVKMKRFHTRLVGNHAPLEWTATNAVCIGPFHLRLENVRRVEQRGELFLLTFALPAMGLRTIKPSDQRWEPAVTVTNESDQPQKIHVRITALEDARPLTFMDEEKTLAPGQTWRFAAIVKGRQ